MSIGVVIPTFNGARHIEHCLSPLLASDSRILVIDSSSTDDTAEIAKKMGAEVMVIPKRAFNHGLTREMGRKQLQTEIVAFLSQDAYATDSDALEKLVSPLRQGIAHLAYARQLPHKNADFFEAFPRIFNYPEKSERRTIHDVPKLGSSAFFFSNSCAAYLNSALDAIGGFPKIAFGEDAFAAAKLLHSGHALAYVAEARFYHSHRYSLKEEFKRHIAIGATRQTLRPLIGSDTARGRAYVKALFQTLWKERPTDLPYACLQTGVKWLGYRIGGSGLTF